MPDPVDYRTQIPRIRSAICETVEFSVRFTMQYAPGKRSDAVRAVQEALERSNELLPGVAYVKAVFGSVVEEVQVGDL